MTPSITALGLDANNLLVSYTYHRFYLSLKLSPRLHQVLRVGNGQPGTISGNATSFVATAIYLDEVIPSTGKLAFDNLNWAATKLSTD